MEIEFYGASEGVTGSCHIIRNEGRTLLLDCGLIQGGRTEEARNREPFPFDPRTIDAVVLSHAHIDHSGRLPLLVKQGFNGPVYTQNASRELCRVLLLDAASLARRDAEYENRRRNRNDKEPVQPLFEEEDVLATLELMRGLAYGEKRRILPGIELRFRDAGHILGSACIELWLSEKGQNRKLVYSGDIGQYDTPILNDPEALTDADVVIMESTYGDRLHRDRLLTEQEIGEVISAARHERGNILIPAFAIGRSQELIYLLGLHYDAWEIDRWEVFLDSPMAIEASRIYWDYPQLYDSAAIRLRNKLPLMPQLNNLHFTRSVEESQAINRLKSGAIIIAGSGMCNGGRILHHFKQNTWRKESHILIVGYQAEGTLGRRLVNGEPQVRIHGETYAVRARIHTVGGLSAHADRDDLLRWISSFATRPRVYIVHGETEAREAFRDTLVNQTNLQAQVAHAGQRVDLIS